MSNLKLGALAAAALAIPFGIAGAASAAALYDFGNAPWDGQPTGYAPGGGRASAGHFPSASSQFPDTPAPVARQDQYAPFASVHGGVYFGSIENGVTNAQANDPKDGIAIGASPPICARRHGGRTTHFSRALAVTISLDGIAPAGGQRVYLNFWA